MTHEVTNQPPPLAGYDVAADQALLTAVGSYGGGWVIPELHKLGELAGSAEVIEQARLANVHEPVLRTHDRYGNRIDEVEFHPAWHQLMTTAVSHGLHAGPWASTQPGAHVARAAKFYVWTQAEAGHGCPISMTYSVIPALRHAPDLASRFEPLLASA
jgi:putative acyl-CoA dehydrogenase